MHFGLVLNGTRLPIVVMAMKMVTMALLECWQVVEEMLRNLRGWSNERQIMLHPEGNQGVHKFSHHLVGVEGTRSNAKALSTDSNSWVVDRLHVDTVVAEEFIRILTIEASGRR